MITRRTRITYAACAAATLLAFGGCGSSGEPTVSAQDAAVSAFAQSLSPCDGPVDGADASSVLTMQGAWFRLSSAEATVAEDDSLPSMIEADAEYVGGDPSVEAAARAAEGQTRFLASAGEAVLTAQAVADGAETYLKVEVVGPDLMVIFPVAFNADGDFAFVGNCRAERYTIPLTVEYGSRTAELVRGLVGADVTETERLLGLDVPTSAPATPEAPPLNPEFTDPEVLQRLAVGDLILTPAPDSWIGPYTLCPKIQEGWSPCFDLSSTAAHGQPAMIYFNPERPIVEFWLADESADLTAPIALVSTIDVADEVAVTQRSGVGIVTITLTLPSSGSVDSVADGSTPPVDVTISADVVAG